MCLNYEHNRNRKFNNSNLNEDERTLKKNEVHLKNLKLKFSRKLTCYSFLLSLLLADTSVLTQDDILNIAKLTPLQRLQNLAQNQEIKPEIEKLIELYFWFLQKTQVEKQEAIDWIDIKKNRDDAFDKSRQFAKVIFNMMMNTKNRDILLYFLI